MSKFETLDPLLHQSLRLAIVSVLVAVESAEFVYLKEKTGATAGNLSVQIDKLQEAGYIQVVKDYNGKKPRTTCTLSPAGRDALEAYVNALKSYIQL